MNEHAHLTDFTSYSLILGDFVRLRLTPPASVPDLIATYAVHQYSVAHKNMSPDERDRMKKVENDRADVMC